MTQTRSAVGPAPVAMVVGAVSSLQFGAAWAGTLFDEVGPLGAVLLRLAFAAVVLQALWRPSVRGLSGAQWRLVGAFGLTLGAMNASIYASFDRIPLGVAVTLEFLGPLGVAVAGSRRALDLVWVVLAAAGIVILGAGELGGRLDTLGVVLALVAAACWAAYIALGARVGRAFGAGPGLALAMVVGALAVAPAGLLAAGDGLLDGHVLAVGLAVAVVSSVIPYTLELEALQRMPARVFGVLMSLEPGVAALAGLTVLGQDLRAAEVMAIVLVVTASAGAALTARVGAPQPAPA